MGRAEAVVAAVVVVVAVGVEGVMFHLQPNTQKCFKEEIHKNVLVSGEYEVQEAPGQKVDIQVCYARQVLRVAGGAPTAGPTSHHKALRVVWGSL